MAIFNCYIKLPAGKPLSSCTLGTSSAPSLGSRSPAFSSSPAKAGKCSSEARREQKRAPREEPGARIGDLCCLIRWLGIVPWRLWKVKDEVWNQILGDFFPWQVMKDDEFWHWILEWHFGYCRSHFERGLHHFGGVWHGSNDLSPQFGWFYALNDRFSGTWYPMLTHTLIAIRLLNLSTKKITCSRNEIP
jgi:hypothetical protein